MKDRGGVGRRTETIRSRMALWPDIVVLLILWCLLLRIQNPGLMADDSGEMAAAAVGLGISHPPGYPLIALLGHLISWVPVGTPAFRMNLLSQAFLLIALWISFPMMDHFGKAATGTWGSFRDKIFFILFFFSIRPLVSQALTGKGAVYTLSLLLGCLLLRVLLSKGDSVRRGWGATFLWAMGMANHWQTMILWGPMVAWHWIRNHENRKPKTFVTGLSFVLLGLSTYLFLPLRAIRDCVPSWGYPVHPSLFYWVLSRQLVSRVEHWVQSFGFYRGTLLEMSKFFLWGIFPLLVPLSLFAIGTHLREHRKRIWTFFLFGGPVLAGVFLIHEKQNIYLIPVYLVALGTLMALVAWGGFKTLHELLPRGLGARVLVGGLGLALLVWDVQVFRTEDKSGYFLAEDFGINALRDTPRGAILLTEGDPYVMSIWYQRIVNGKRPDIVFEPAVFLVHGWGWKQIGDQSAEMGMKIRASNLFQERLKCLTGWGRLHPFCYSLDHEKMGEALRCLPGGWRSHGLIMEWTSSKGSPSSKTLKSPYRIRGAHPLPNDPASMGILAHYQATGTTFGLE